MFCKNCGGKLNEDSKFCLNCGAKLEAPVKTKTPGYIFLIIILLSILLIGEAGFIIYDEFIAPESYSSYDKEDDSSSDNTSSGGSSLGDTSSDNFSDQGSSDKTESGIGSGEFSPSVICGSWHLSSFVDDEGNAVTPQVNAFLSLTLNADESGNGIYAVYEGRNEERILTWKYMNPMKNGSHYYELEATNGDSYALCYNPETNQLYMVYCEDDNSETTRYYSLD